MKCCISELKQFGSKGFFLLVVGCSSTMDKAWNSVSQLYLNL